MFDAADFSKHQYFFTEQASLVVQIPPAFSPPLLFPDQLILIWLVMHELLGIIQLQLLLFHLITRSF